MLLEKISAIGIDPCFAEGKHFEPDYLPAVEATVLFFYFVLETNFYTQRHLTLFSLWENLHSSNGLSFCFGWLNR